MKVIALLAALFSAPDQAELDAFTAVYNDLEPKFTYVSDMEMWGVPHFAEPNVTGDEPFAGDCEEYMMAGFNQLMKRGVLSAPVVTKDHVMLCGKTWCIDTQHRGAFRRPQV